MYNFLTNLTNIIIILILQGGPPPPGDDGSTDIDELLIDNYLIYGTIIAVVIAIITIYKLRKSY